MPDVRLIPVTPLDRDSFAPFGQYLAHGPDEAEIAVRDGEEWVLNILSYDRMPLTCDHLNAHHRATQALFPLGSRPALLVVAPPGTVFAGPEDLAAVRAFVLDGNGGVNLSHGTWHWGPYPLGDHVDVVNLQGRGFADDNEIAHLERDLGTVIQVVL